MTKYLIIAALAAGVGLSAQVPQNLLINQTQTHAVKWDSASLMKVGRIYASFTRDWSQVTFTPDAVEMRVCMPSGQCRTVFEIAAWMEQQAEIRR